MLKPQMYIKTATQSLYKEKSQKNGISQAGKRNRILALDISGWVEA